MIGRDLIGRYDLFLLDAYGVLVNASGALPHARTFIQQMIDQQVPYYIVTNDASRLPQKAAAFYQSVGLPIPVERVLTAGLAIEPALRALEASGDFGAKADDRTLRCAVLGTADTHEYVDRAGARLIPISDDAEFDALVVGDDSGFDVLPTLNQLLSALNRMIEHGLKFRLLLANPDLLYPRGQTRFGFTSGTLARILEIGLKQLRPELDLKFEVLGKPTKTLYEMGIARAEAELGRKIELNRTVMLGDQMHTDIRGAQNAGVRSALLMTGITLSRLDANHDKNPPDHILESL